MVSFDYDDEELLPTLNVTWKPFHGDTTSPSQSYQQMTKRYQIMDEIEVDLIGLEEPLKFKVM